MKKEYMKPSIETVKIQHQYIICTSPGGETHTDDPQDPGNSMVPGLFEGEEWDILLGE